MWLFTKDGHLSIGQHSSDASYLVVHSRMQEEMDKFVAVLDRGRRPEARNPGDDGRRLPLPRHGRGRSSPRRSAG